MTTLVVWSILSTILGTLGVGAVVSIAIALWDLVSGVDHVAFCLEQQRQWTEQDRDNRSLDDIPYVAVPLSKCEFCEYQWVGTPNEVHAVGCVNEIPKKEP